jgi:hypothetical protein
MNSWTLANRKPWLAIALIAGLFATSATGFAQDDPGATPPAADEPGGETTAGEEPATPAGTAEAPAGSPDAERRFGSTAALTPGEQQTQAANYMKKMQSIHERAQQMGKKARDDRDLIKLNCVNDKLLQIRGNLNVAESTNNKLQTAIAAGDEGGRNHEFSKLTIIFQKVTVLGQEADACVGEEIAYVGKTRVTVDVDPAVEAAKDPTEESTPLAPIGRPPLASPFI